MSTKNPIHLILGLLTAIVGEDGKARINDAAKRFVLIVEDGKEMLRQELVDGILRARVQAKRMKALADTLEKLAITKLEAGALFQEGAHSLELTARTTTSNSYAKAAQEMWETYREAAGIPDGVELKDWMEQQGFASKGEKPTLRIDGRLQ